ncbi:DUF1853 family protein [Pseudotenacibaculum haliotis]|uniref:DUF1853 family protein n=1 Tax=Pseudotenacibaculum haliotis TaxID=1862138 RepID=A0ABW5LRX6_9FLAO
MNLTQQRFFGFQNTPFLWEKSLLELEQFLWTPSKLSIGEKISDTIRLGNYVERLVSYELHQHSSIQVLKENVQIISDKVTLGEIDCLLMDHKEAVHLEIAYKFYLYDATVGSDFLDHWIGPNRRDSLVLKLNKIKNKQFPLLYSKECASFLSELKLKANNIQQRTYFKAQLYIPFGTKIDFKQLNPECVCGFYMDIEQLQKFSDCKFYIPKKLDWLIEPHKDVDWLNFEQAQKRINEFHQKQSAPLCWLKQTNGEILKIFVTWWTVHTS